MDNQVSNSGKRARNSWPVGPTAELHLLALDPIRGLRAVLRTSDRYTRLDPKVREATTLIRDRLSEVSDADGVDDVLAPLWWLGVREQLMIPAGVQLVQRLLGDGELVLRTVDDALASSLSPDVLNQVASVVRQDAHDDAALATRLRDGRDELSQVRDELPEDNPLALAAGAATAFLLGMYIGALAAEIVHHHHHEHH